MKKLLLLLSMVPATIFSQTTYFEANFDGTDPLSGFKAYDQDQLSPLWFPELLDVGWGVYDASLIGETGGFILSTSSYSGAAGPADDWLVTPAIDLSAVTGSISLSWKAMSMDPDNRDAYKVWISTTGDTPGDFSTTLFDTTVTGEVQGAWQTHSIDLSAYAGQVILLAWQNYSHDKVALLVDNILVDNTVTLGVTSVKIDKSVGKLYPNPAVDYFKIDNISQFNKATTKIIVTDLSGKQVLSTSYAESVDVTKLAKGNYVVTVTDGSKSENHKLIKK